MVSPGEAIKVMLTTRGSDTGLRQKEQSGLWGNPHFAIFLRLGMEFLM